SQRAAAAAAHPARAGESLSGGAAQGRSGSAPDDPPDLSRDGGDLEKAQVIDARVDRLEYFHDHARIERWLLDGVLTPEDGALRPDPSRPGFGVELRHADAARYQVLP